MAFNFPNSPGNGQTYTPVGGPVFTWDGTAWKALSQGMPVTVFVADTPPAAPSFGNLWWESDTGNLFIYYNDGDSAQWVQINGTPAGYQTADTRNRIVNGGFQISQENGGASVGNAGYPADEWKFSNNLAGVTATVNRSPNSTVPLAAPAYLRIAGGATAKPSLAAGEYILVSQAVEGIRISDFLWGSPDARPVMLRFVAWSDVPGTYTVTFRNLTFDRCYVMPFAVTTQQTVFSIAVPGCKDGVWAVDGTMGLNVVFGWAIGATSQTATPNTWVTSNVFGATGMSNLVATANNTVRIAQVGLYLDPDNTGVAPKWQMPDEAEELRACERYFQKSYRSNVYGGAADADGTEYWTTTCSTTGTDWGFLKFRTRMRTTGATTLYPQGGGASGNVTCQGLVKPGQAANSSDTGAWVRVTGTTGLTAGQGSMSFHWLANSRM